MRYIIYGAGAVGGTIGARLFMANCQVLLIARGEHLEVIQSRGLRYRNPEVDEILPIEAVSHPREIAFTPDDVVVLTVKSQQASAALNDLAMHAPADIPLFCAQNGVANESLASRRFEHVYAQMIWMPATHLNPGEVLHPMTGAGAVLDAGRFPMGIDATVTQYCDDLTRAGLKARAIDQPMRWKYAKLLRNLGNALQAVCGYQDANSESGRQVMSRVRAEALACFDAAGIELTTRDEVQERLQGMIRGEIDGEAYAASSSWQSLQRGSPDIEADFLNGEICMLGKVHNIPTPANRMLCVLANELAHGGHAPGHYHVDEVLAKVTAFST